MTINPQALIDHDFGTIEQHYRSKDVILYALGLGLGKDPVDSFDLRFLDETKLSVLSSYAVTMGTPGMWIRDPKFGVNFRKLVHSQQMAWFGNKLPISGEIVAKAKVISLTDRGEGRGAVLVLERQIEDQATGQLLCRLHQTLMLRGDGGFGGKPSQRPERLIPERDPDHVTSFETSPRAALIYRLSGDWNPLHIDPETAKKAGFERPILHGLASYGIAGLALSRAMGCDPSNLNELGCSFSGVVTPGDDIRFDIWKQEDQSCVFRGFVGDRKVLDNGKISWRTPS